MKKSLIIIFSIILLIAILTAPLFILFRTNKCNIASRVFGMLFSFFSIFYIFTVTLPASLLHTLIHFVAKLFCSFLFTALRCKRPININYRARLFAPFPFFIRSRHTVNGRAQIHRVLKRGCGKRTDVRVIFPNMRLGIYNYRMFFFNTMLYRILKPLHTAKRFGYRQRADMRQNLADYRQIHVSSVCHGVYPFWKTHKRGVKHITDRLCVIAVQKKSFRFFSHISCANNFYMQKKSAIYV